MNYFYKCYFKCGWGMFFLKLHVTVALALGAGYCCYRLFTELLWRKMSCVRWACKGRGSREQNIHCNLDLDCNSSAPFSYFHILCHLNCFMRKYFYKQLLTLLSSFFLKNKKPTHTDITLSLAISWYEWAEAINHYHSLSFVGNQNSSCG